MIALIGIVRRRCARRLAGLLAAAMIIAAGSPLPAVASPAPELAEAVAAFGDVGFDLETARAETARVREALAEMAQVSPDAGATSATARLSVRLNQLEEDLRAATGRIEEVSFKVRRLEERLDKFIADVDYRLNEPGRAGGAAPVRGAEPAVPPPSAGGPRVLGQGVSSASPAPAPEASPPAPQPAAPQNAATAATGSAREDYARAFGLLQKGNHAEAEAAFTGFLQHHKDDPLAENARYWLGETHYARADYQRAAQTFLDAYEKSKTGTKAPDTLLKLGLSLSGLGKTKEACATFREIGRAFPEAAPVVKDRAKQEQQKLKCP